MSSFDKKKDDHKKKDDDKKKDVDKKKDDDKKKEVDNNKKRRLEAAAAALRAAADFVHALSLEED